MRKIIWLCLFVFMLVGCSKDEVSVFDLEKPPEVEVKVAGKLYQTALGSYCWGNICSDKDSPKNIIKEKDIIKVSPNEKLTLVPSGVKEKAHANFNYIIDSTNQFFSEWDVPVEGLTLTAPAEKGRYYFLATVIWEEGSQSAVSSYYFGVDVE